MTNTPDNISIEIISIATGKITHADITGKPEPTAFNKRSILGPAMIGENGIEGDSLGTPRKLGIKNHAVYVVPEQTISYWGEKLPHMELNPGSLGENLVISGIDEQTVNIGDLLRFADVELKVIQPRIPCYKLAHFLKMPQSFPYEFLKSTRTGFYCAVSKAGKISQGEKGNLIKTTSPHISIERFIELTQFANDASALRELLGNHNIIDGWKENIQKRIDKIETQKTKSKSKWASVKCAKVVNEGDDVKSFHLEFNNEISLPARGGQFLSLCLERDGKDIVRNYSVSAVNNSDIVNSGHMRISVNLERSSDGRIGTVSGILHSEIQAGDIIKSSSPAGHFVLPADSDVCDILLLSGGIGITPMLGMLWDAVSQKNKSRFRLVHSVRAKSTIPFANELSKLTELLPNIKIEIFNTGNDIKNEHNLSINSGRLDLSKIISEAPKSSRIYVCGPNNFIKQTVSNARDCGFSGPSLVFESFGGGIQETKGSDSEIIHRVLFANSGISTVWQAGAGSLLDLAISNGINVEYSCRSGICGSCAADILSGRASYPPEIAREEGSSGKILLCSAIPQEDIVIDL